MRVYPMSAAGPWPGCSAGGGRLGWVEIRGRGGGGGRLAGGWSIAGGGRLPASWSNSKTPRRRWYGTDGEANRLLPRTNEQTAALVVNAGGGGRLGLSPGNGEGWESAGSTG